MTKRIVRHSDFEITLNIHSDKFLSTPRASQRQWLIQRLLKETHDELVHLDRQAESMVSGSDELIDLDRATGVLADDDIMEDWQIPVMREMASIVCANNSDVLEIGMGRGIASDFIQSHEPKSHTIIECNKDIATTRFEHWKRQYAGRAIHMHEALWQDCLASLSKFDGILFHTYPLNDEEFVQTVVKDVTFAAHFLETASKHLHTGGSLTYLTNEVDSFSRAHQRALFEHFSSVTLSLIRDLDIPDNTRDALWVNQIVLVKAVK